MWYFQDAAQILAKMAGRVIMTKGPTYVIVLVLILVSIVKVVSGLVIYSKVTVILRHQNCLLVIF